MDMYRYKPASITNTLVIQQWSLSGGCYRPVYVGCSVLTASSKEQAKQIISNLERSDNE